MLAVLLDMGGVLLPEISGFLRTQGDPLLVAQLRQLGVDDPEARIEDTGLRLRRAYRELEGAGTQPDPNRVLADVPIAVRRRLLQAFAKEEAQPVFSYAREVVAQLARHYRLGLVSNNVIPGDHHARALARAGIACHLDAALWSANFGRRKPDPEILHEALRQLGVAPRCAIFVGDKRRTDVEAARRAGVRSILLRRGPAAAQGAEPDFVVQDLREVPRLLAGLA